MKTKIDEAVIIASGLGTRMLPYTKTITKEMLPVFDVPAIFLLVKEAYLSGIKKIIFVVTKKNKKLIQNFFSNDTYLNNFLKNEPEKFKLLEEINLIIKKINFKYVYQVEKGSYGSVYSARNYLKNDNFVVMYCDDIFDSETPLVKQLIMEFQNNQKMILAVKKLPYDQLSKNGVIKIDENSFLTDITQRENASNLIALGRFILNKKIFTIKKQLPYYKNNELYLPHSLLNFKGEVKVYCCDDEYFDIGEKIGFIKASIHYGLKNNLYKNELIAYLKKLNIK